MAYPSLMAQSLLHTSQLAAQLWQQLQAATTPDAETTILESLWQVQTDQEAAIDAQAELADQLDAEIQAIQARLAHLTAQHQAALSQLQRWRNGLDHALLAAHEHGLLPDRQLVGQHRTITIRDNPPSCEVLVEVSELPDAYRTVETKTVLKANKQAIIAAWKQGQAVPGTYVGKRRRVVYRLNSPP